MHQTLDQIFISHSKKDEIIKEAFHKYFEDTSIKPFFAELETWSREKRPDWDWISDNIKKSKAVFALISRNVEKLGHTRNWVALEIGIALAFRKPIWVFKVEWEDEFPEPFAFHALKEPISFPVPYLDHYVPMDSRGQRFTNGNEQIAKDSANKKMKMAIEKPEKIFDEKVIHCESCRIRFCYHGLKSEFECPCCSKTIKRYQQKRAR